MATSPAVVLEPAHHRDLDAIRSLDGLGDSTRRMVDRDLGRDDHRLLVARDPDGTVVGFGAVSVAAGEATLLDLAIAPTWRRRGLGARLADALRGLARDELAATAMTLEVRVGNAAARALYRRLGFVAAGIRPGYYPDGGPDGGREDAVIMWDHDLS